MLKYLLQKIALAESQRSEHVKSEDDFEIPTTSHKVTDYVVQRHKAEKSGEHYDFRLLIDGKAISFASRKLLPAELHRKYLQVQQPSHTKEYMSFSGTIPAGYGKGEVEIAHQGKAIVASSPNKLHVLIPDGPVSGAYHMIRTQDKNFIAMKQQDPTFYYHEKKGTYSTKIPDYVLDDKDWIASDKIDGAQNIVHIDQQTGKPGIVSVRKSVTGDLIIKNAHIPHISSITFPKKYRGMAFRAELHVPGKDFSTLSGILNSGPVKAVETQEKVGKIHMAPFQVLKEPGGKENPLSYEKQLELLKQLETDVASPFIRVPSYTKENKKEFIKSVLKRGGEGVVIGHKDALNESKFYKIKKNYDFTFKIIGATEGQGRLKGKGIGGFIIADKEGRTVGVVGSGLNDKIRQDAYQNFDNYKDKLIKTQAMEPTALFSVRHPVFMGFATDSNEADKLETSEESRILSFLQKINLK